MTILKRNALEKAWCAETGYHGHYNFNCPCEGQCVPTALLIQDMFGGILKGCRIGQSRHFYNVIDGRIVDFTNSQFGPKEIVKAYDKTSYVIDREDLLKQLDINRRYLLLKERYEQESKSSS